MAKTIFKNFNLIHQHLKDEKRIFFSEYASKNPIPKSFMLRRQWNIDFEDAWEKHSDVILSAITV